MNQVATDLGITEKQSNLSFIIKNMYECFLQRDALEITINPLIFCEDNTFRAANMKVEIDPDSYYR